MHHRAVLALAATVPMVAAQTVTVTSHCSFPIYLWNVVNTYGSGPPDATLDSSNPTWSSPFESKTAYGADGGASIKLKPNNNIFDGQPLSQAEYKMTGSTLFYDWSLINGAPFAGQAFTMETSDSSCPTVNCPAGSNYCPGAYYQPDDVATLACNGNNNLIVTICGGGSSSGSSPAPVSSAAPAPAPAPSSSSVAPAPAPSSSSAAPVQPATTPAPNNGGGFLEGESGNGVPMETVVATTIVPVTVTKHMPAATPQVGSDGVVTEGKREAHLHEHQHRGFSRVMGRHSH